ncbi:MAG: M16 family metallopeptidase [Mangrovibacterium sp.]
MKKFHLLSAMLLLLSSMQLAQAQNIEFSEFDLENGLHVILYTDNSSPNVTVGVHYNVGSKNEDPKLTGFAHFFEHLMFEGTEYIGRGEYMKMIENAGGTLNAYTNVDKTYYYETIPSNQLELALWMESERMFHAKVDSIGIATQKRVVAEEKKQRYDSQPYGDWQKLIMERAFHVHPYSWPTIGDVDKLMEAKDSNFVDFYETYYVPNNACLIIAGDINKDKVKAMVEKYFDDIPRGTKHMHRPTEIEPPLTQEICDTVYRDVQIPAVIQAYRVPEDSNSDTYALTMLNQLLSAGNSSRLHRKLVDENQLALQISAGNFGYQDPSVLAILGLTSVNVDPKTLNNAIDAQIKNVQENLISEHEFEKLRNQIESSTVNGYRKVSTIADKLGDCYTYYHNTNRINEEEDELLSVTREDIQRVARKYLTPNNRIVLYYLPKSMNPTAAE